jgi:apolipoprotein N-acyltransferase
MTSLRGVESGFAVVRASREGLLTVSDRFGRVIAETHSSALPGASLLARVPIDPVRPTFYARFGDVFGWICVALAVGLVLFRKRLLAADRAY